MILPARKFLNLLLIAFVVNVVGYIFYFIHAARHMYHRNSTSKRRQNYVVSMDWKLLYNNIVCNDTATLKMTETYSHRIKNVSQYTRSATKYENHTNTGREDNVYKLCPAVPPGLGPVSKDSDIMNLHGIDDMYLRIQMGGIHIPTECVERRACVERPNSKLLLLSLFIRRIKNSTKLYERGKLFNIGYVEAQTYRSEGWDCFIFHDSHLVPLDTRNLYRCSKNPKKLIADFQMPLRFGGAVAITPKDFAKSNGFSNLIWTNDGDYVDMYKRLIAANLTVEGNTDPIGSYTAFDSLLKVNDESLPNRPNLTYKQDGLSNLFYDIGEINSRQFYTLIEVDNVDSQGTQNSSNRHQ